MNSINYKKSAQKLETYKRLSFKEKVSLSKRKIRTALNTHNEPLVSSSFGKDSVTLIYLVKEVTDNFEVVFNKTGIQYKETIEFMRELEDEWDLELHIIEPDKTFWEIVDEYGYPKSSRNSKTGDKRVPKCCKFLKEDPMRDFIEENSFDLDFVGINSGKGSQSDTVVLEGEKEC
ncbi:hypothetical protein C9439_04295 [archaeon SCG-AAA382B04]|nr:hypothetical protein C9439_04295 [archaeon SCG-AAA382B04]